VRGPGLGGRPGRWRPGRDTPRSSLYRVTGRAPRDVDGSAARQAAQSRRRLCGGAMFAVAACSPACSRRRRTGRGRRTISRGRTVSLAMRPVSSVQSSGLWKDAPAPTCWNGRRAFFVATPAGESRQVAVEWLEARFFAQIEKGRIPRRALFARNDRTAGPRCLRDFTGLRATRERDELRPARPVCRQRCCVSPSVEDGRAPRSAQSARADLRRARRLRPAGPRDALRR